MKRIWFLGLIPVSFSIILLFNSHFSLPSIPAIQASASKNIQNEIQYELHDLPQSRVHILSIPPGSRFLLIPAISDTAETVEEFAQKYSGDKQQVSAVINAGFFDPVNQKSTSYVTISGQLVGDPQKNDRLVNNPNLKSYLNQIFNRTEFRRYLCGGVTRYDVSPHNRHLPQGCELIDAVGAGPQLLPKLNLVTEAFTDVAHKRDALGSNELNARTAIGIKHDGTVVLVMVAEKPAVSGDSGISLPKLAKLMKTLGVEKAMNLDGGSSSSLYYKGKVFYGKIDASGNPVKRPVKSVLLVKQRS